MVQDLKQKEYKYNMLVNALDGASFWFGQSFVSSSTIIPLFISKLTTSTLPIGLASVLAQAGWFIPQLFAARLTEGKDKMKPIVVNAGFFLERLPVMLFVLSGILAISSPQSALVSFLFFYAWFYIGAGILGPAWQALIAKIIKVQHRGRFLGITTFLGVSMGMLGSFTSAAILDRLAFPHNFILLFIISGVFMVVSWVFLGLTREPKEMIPLISTSNFEYLKNLAHVLRDDANFRNYILAKMVLSFGGMGTGFIALYAYRSFSLPDSSAGIFTFMALAGQAIGNLVLGWLADKAGHKISLVIGGLSATLAFILAAFIPSSIIFYIVFLLVGINTGSGIVSGTLIIMEFCPSNKVAVYSGLINTFAGLIGMVAPLIGAAVAATNFKLLFIISGFFFLIGNLGLFLFVKEPRKKTAMPE